MANIVLFSFLIDFCPNQAERKGATASQYGLVFGIFELTVFFASPIIGHYVTLSKAKWNLFSCLEQMRRFFPLFSLPN